MPNDAPPPPTASPGPSSRLYPKLLGAAWYAVAPAVQRAHTDVSLTHADGIFQVSRAPGALLGRVLDLAGVPRASRAAGVRLVVRHRGLVERWHRTFGGRPLVTYQWATPGGLLTERAGLFEFWSSLTVQDGAILFRQEGSAIRLGRLRIPLPGWLTIAVAGREGPADPDDDSVPRTTVDVRVTAPGGSLLFAYRGTVRWRSGGDA
jgi:hypothetical protein